jgi:hypothetical protein
LDDLIHQEINIDNDEELSQSNPCNLSFASSVSTVSFQYGILREIETDRKNISVINSESNESSFLPR